MLREEEEEEEAAVAMTSKYSSETRDDDELKKVAMVRPSLFHHDSCPVVTSSFPSHLDSTVRKPTLDHALTTNIKEFASQSHFNLIL